MMQAALDEARAEGERRAWPDTKTIVLPRDPDDRKPDPIAFILGLAAEPWKIHGIADLLRDSGEVDVPRKAEAEMAAALHWLIGLAIQHGEDWGQACQVEIARLKALVPSPAKKES